MFTRYFGSEKSTFYKFIVILVLVSLLSSFWVYYFEKDSNPGFAHKIDIFYWWVNSMTTAGNSAGPITHEGKVAGMVTLLSGAVMYLSLFSEFILWIKSKSDEKFKGMKHYKGDNHVIIVGFNSLTLGLINILERVLKNEVDIVLVTSHIDTNPNPDRIKFVKINPTVSQSLKKVNASSAKLAFVLASDDSGGSASVDLNTMMIASSIEELQSNVFTYAEVEHVSRLRKFGFMKVDAEFTAEDLLNDLSKSAKDSKLIGKLTKQLKKELLKDEFV